MKALLTSTGFDNKNIETAFLSLVEKPALKLKALFIPTALNTDDSKEYIHVFKDDLLNAGVLEGNIETYDLNMPFDTDEICFYNVVYFCPGSPEYLIERINAVKFPKNLNSFLDNGGILLGVSADSDIVGNNFSDGLNLIDIYIVTHVQKGSPAGDVDISTARKLYITDNQAVLINREKISVIE